MSEPIKLSEQGLGAIRNRESAKHLDYAHSRAVSDVGLLLDHIAAMEAEQRAGASRAASDAFEVGHANATFIEQQTKRIQDLEQTNVVFNLIQAEMDRQDAKWGDQSERPGIVWLAILTEEVGEVAKALLERKGEEYRTEMIQVAAVAVQAIRAVKG